MVHIRVQMKWLIWISAVKAVKSFIKAGVKGGTLELLIWDITIENCLF